jgi:hypothetical protein
MRMGHTTAVDTRKSSRCRPSGGELHLPSEPAAARQSTQTASVSFGLGPFEVIFWPMWWKLPLWEKRQVTTEKFQSWMFGPWELRRY